KTAWGGRETSCPPTHLNHPTHSTYRPTRPTQPTRPIVSRHRGPDRVEANEKTPRGPRARGAQRRTEANPLPAFRTGASRRGGPEWAPDKNCPFRTADSTSSCHPRPTSQSTDRSSADQRRTPPRC